MRTFVAIELKSELKIILTQFIKKLDRHDPNIRWIRDHGMHLTLKFIGEITEDQARKIQSVLMDISLKHEHFPLKILGTGTFPPRSRHPRILWVGIEENQKLMSVQDELETELEKVSISREQRRFFPHLTLGRVKSNHNISSVLKEFSEKNDTEFGSMEVEEITFFKSNLKPSGAEYTTLSKIQLK